MPAELLAHAGVTAHGGDGEVGVGAQQSEDLSPGIAGGAGDGDRQIVHMNNHTASLNYMQEA